MGEAIALLFVNCGPTESAEVGSHACVRAFSVSDRHNVLILLRCDTVHIPTPSPRRPRESSFFYRLGARPRSANRRQTEAAHLLYGHQPARPAESSAAQL